MAEPIKKVYRLLIDGKPRKTYGKLNHLKSAIHVQTAAWRDPVEITVEEYDVLPPVIKTAADIMGAPCPECGEFPHKNWEYNHKHTCSKWGK